MNFSRGHHRVTTSITGTDLFKEDEHMGRYGKTAAELAEVIALERKERIAIYQENNRLDGLKRERHLCSLLHRMWTNQISWDPFVQRAVHRELDDIYNGRWTVSKLVKEGIYG